jgi:NADH:ubiquinone oxidoreductase subunit 4 (subunit M)
VAVDGISLWPVLLTLGVVPLALFGADERVHFWGRELGVPLLLLQSGALAVFLSADAGLLIVGFELVVFASWALRGIGNDPEDRRSAARWLVGAQVGAGALLLAMLLLAVARYNATPGEWSTSLDALAGVLPEAGQQRVGFALLLFAAAFTVPLFPLHGWITGLCATRNPVSSAVSAAILVEVGVHLLGRHALVLFPLGAADLGDVVAWAAVAGCVHGVLAMRVERSLERLIGYLVLAGAGVEVVGVLCAHADAWSGVGLFGLGRGFALVAALLVAADLRGVEGHALVDRVRGLGTRAPLAAASLLVAALAMLAAPGSAGFAGIALLLGASVRAEPTPLSTPLLACTLATLACLAGAAVVLARWSEMLAHGADSGRVPIGSGRSRLAAVLALAACLTAGLWPSRLVVHGTQTTREKAAQVRDRLCVAESARALGRARMIEGLPAGSCEALRAGEGR